MDDMADIFPFGSEEYEMGFEDKKSSVVYTGKSQLSEGRYLFASEGLRDIQNNSIESGLVRVLSVKKPHKASQKNYVLTLQRDSEKPFVTVVSSRDLDTFFSIDMNIHTAGKGVFSELIQSLARKYRKEIDPKINWDRLFKASASKIINSFNMSFLSEEQKEDLISDSVLECVNDRTMEQFGDNGGKDPVYYFISMFQNKMRNNLVKYINESKNVRDFGYDEEGEEFIPESEMNTQRRMEDEKQKQRIPEEEYFRKLDMVDSKKKFDYVMEDFRDFLYNVPGAGNMLAVLDGREAGKTFAQIGADMKPKPMSAAAVCNWAKKLADQFVYYAKFVEDEWLYQLAVACRNSTYKQASRMFDADLTEEELTTNEIQQSQKALDTMLDTLKKDVDRVDIPNLLENGSLPEDKAVEILGLEKGVVSFRKTAAPDPMAQAMFIMQDIVNFLDKKDASKSLSTLFSEIATGTPLQTLISKYPSIDSLLESLVDYLSEYADKSGDPNLKSVGDKYLKELKSNTASIYNGAETSPTEDNYEGVSNFCDGVQGMINKIDVKKVVKTLEKPSMKLLNLFGISKTTTNAIESIVDMFTGKRTASTHIKRCSLENILSESNVVDASFDTDTPLAEKKALDQSVYESMVKEYEDIIEEDDSLYGLKVSNSETAQNKEGVLPKNLDLDEKIKVEKKPLINLDGEGYSSSRKSTDFVYEGEDDSHTVPWF